MKSRIQNIFDKVHHMLARIFHCSSYSESLEIKDTHEARNQLCTIIAETKKNALDSQSIVGNIGSSLQGVIDVADSYTQLVPHLKSTDIEEATVLWGLTSRHTISIQDSLENLQTVSNALSSTASLTIVTTSGYFSQDTYDTDPHIQGILTQYFEVTSRPERRDEVADLMRNFNLDNAPPGKQSPLELFHIAHHAFEVPVPGANPAITSLIPMREAINSTLGELLRLRPQQESTGSSDKKKILSICKQLKKDEIDEIVVHGWCEQWHDISNNDLSASKQYCMKRNEWSRKLNRATEFLYSFLTGLDQSKLRR